MVSNIFVFVCVSRWKSFDMCVGPNRYLPIQWNGWENLMLATLQLMREPMLYIGPNSCEHTTK